MNFATRAKDRHDEISLVVIYNFLCELIIKVIKKLIVLLLLLLLLLFLHGFY